MYYKACYAVLVTINLEHRGAYMAERHGVSVDEANSAIEDPDALTINPDPASASGRSIRIIGMANTGRLVTVIVLDDQGIRYGVNGWRANKVDQRRYRDGE